MNRRNLFKKLLGLLPLPFLPLLGRDVIGWERGKILTGYVTDEKGRKWATWEPGEYRRLSRNLRCYFRQSANDFRELLEKGTRYAVPPNWVLDELEALQPELGKPVAIWVEKGSPEYRRLLRNFSRYYRQSAEAFAELLQQNAS